MIRQILSVAELAEYLRVSRHTVYQWINDSKLPFGYYKLCRSVRFDKCEVDRWLETKRIPPVSDTAKP